MATVEAGASGRRRPLVAKLSGSEPAAAAGTASAAYLELLPALQSLDAQLALALRRFEAQRTAGGDDPMTGLRPRLDAVKAELARHPGEPRFAGHSAGSALSEGAQGRFAEFCAAFALTAFDADLLLLALAPEMDSRYARLYAYLQDEAGRVAPSVEFALDLLCATAPDKLERRQHFLDGAPLLRQALIEWLPEAESGLLARGFRVVPEVASVLLAAGPVGPDVAQLKRKGRSELARLARRLEPNHSWDDLVLPADALAQLHEICGQHRHRGQVLEAWGFGERLSLGRGLTVLFSGSPGTGKTLAASVLARELGLELYRIDLSRVVNKYIGETEKNLERVFEAAVDAGAILFFDEADALFGKRSEVKDAHDRYANLEVAYLLQKMEEYEGVAILATNLRQNLDEAFVRRIRVIVEFPFPDEAQRRQIWARMLPDALPLAAELPLDLLARELRLSGAHIRNIALAAAYLAAEEGGGLSLCHIWRAARREYQKLGRAWDEAVEKRSAGL